MKGIEKLSRANFLIQRCLCYSTVLKFDCLREKTLLCIVFRMATKRNYNEIGLTKKLPFRSTFLEVHLLLEKK